jgi:hypothetical protein
MSEQIVDSGARVSARTMLAAFAGTGLRTLDLAAVIRASVAHLLPLVEMS